MQDGRVENRNVEEKVTVLAKSCEKKERKKHKDRGPRSSLKVL